MKWYDSLIKKIEDNGNNIFTYRKFYKYYS